MLCDQIASIFNCEQKQTNKSDQMCPPIMLDVKITVNVIEHKGPKYFYYQVNKKEQTENKVPKMPYKYPTKKQ